MMAVEVPPMCMICVDFQKQRMTLNDARRAYGEMVESLDPEHAREVKQMLEEAEKDATSDDD